MVATTVATYSDFERSGSVAVAARRPILTHGRKDQSVRHSAMERGVIQLDAVG